MDVHSPGFCCCGGIFHTRIRRAIKEYGAIATGKPGAKLAAAAAPAGGDDGYLSYEEVAKHSTPDDLWVIIGEEVYDMSDFADEHPVRVHTSPICTTQLCVVSAPHPGCFRNGAGERGSSSGGGGGGGAGSRSTVPCSSL